MSTSAAFLARTLLLAAVLAAGPAAEAAEVTLSHAALERVIWQVLLTEGGRGYFEGGPEDTCRFAFVQEPKVTAAGGRLRIRFLFSGRAGAEVAGRCVGPGDTFEIFVSGVPALAAGEAQTLRFELPAADCSMVSAAGERVVEPGEFELQLGGSSRDQDLLTARFTIN